MNILRRRTALVLVLSGALLSAITVVGVSDAAPRRRARAHLRRVSTASSSTEAPERDARLVAWLKKRMPPGGSVDADGKVVHTIQPHDSWGGIAEKYFALTTIYDLEDFSRALVRANPSKASRVLKPGVTVRIPRVVDAAYGTGDAARIGLPDDGVLRGIYVRGETAARRTFPAFLDKLAAHGINAIVLDVKDYDGPLSYASKVPLAIESGATARAPLHDYARPVRFAHARGIRVIARVSTFNDQLVSKKHPSMAVQRHGGGRFANGWLDPSNARAQDYAIDLVREALDAGVDEIQLDYVRYPVLGIENADFGLDLRANPRAKVDVISRFVDRVHAVTAARGVPLSLDVFGVIAFGHKVDIERLGQDPPELAKRCEFLSGMVYPSHYDAGFMGFDAPGDHPELAGMGVKSMRENIRDGGVQGGARMRPWLQAMRHKSTTYSPGYIQAEIQSATRAGATGFLLWNPGQLYDFSFRALPVVKRAHRPKS